MLGVLSESVALFVPTTFPLVTGRLLVAGRAGVAGVTGVPGSPTTSLLNCSSFVPVLRKGVEDEVDDGVTGVPGELETPPSVLPYSKSEVRRLLRDLDAGGGDVAGSCCTNGVAELLRRRRTDK